MVDLHSHILYGIDDGSKTLEESLEILNNAYTGGVTDIVVTPHFIKDSKYKANNKKKRELLDSLVKELKKNHIPLHLYLGNEVFIDEGLSKLLDKDIEDPWYTRDFDKVYNEIYEGCIKLINKLDDK